MLPLLDERRVKYNNKDKIRETRDLVVLKAKNATAMVKRAQKLIAHGTIKQSKLIRMMRVGRENFARDIVTEMNRPGLRAFRYRSGMRDLRYEETFRRVEKRVPDYKRKRHRWNAYRPSKLRYSGRSHKIKKHNHS